jgi:hypothetical protein
MSVADGMTSLSVYSSTHSAVEIAERLGIAPTDSHEIGDLRSNRTTYRALHENSMWSIAVRDEDARPLATGDDADGFASIAAIIALLAGKDEALASLRDDGCDTIVRWHGTGTGQQGFVLPIEIIRGLAGLGCNLVGNIWFDDEDAAAS